MVFTESLALRKALLSYVCRVKLSNENLSVRVVCGGVVVGHHALYRDHSGFISKLVQFCSLYVASVLQTVYINSNCRQCRVFV